jgi:HAD superfamily hydrolase (TIGR01662 family)
MRSALFLDLGGTLLRVENDEIYVSPDGKVEILPNVVESLSVKETELVFVVTNQSGIEKGYLSITEVKDFIDHVFDAVGLPVDDYWACPSTTSVFRKPSPSMVLALADKHYVDLGKSLYVGDSQSDEECARSAGVSRFIWAWGYFNWNQG